MMTREKAAAFLRGFEKDQLLAWWVALADWRWPDDLPFFAKPLALTGDRAETDEEKNALVGDRVWLSLFVGIHDVTTHEERVHALAFSEAMQRFYAQIEKLTRIIDAADFPVLYRDANRAMVEIGIAFDRFYESVRAP